MVLKNIALSGGGFMGYALVSSLEELEKYEGTINIQSICGTSVGAMVGGLWAVGYTAEELKKIMFELNFEELIKDSAVPYINLYEKYGMYEAINFEQLIEKLIEEKTQRKFCTFSQINKNLTIVATNINLQKPVFFNKETTPKLAISKAIRMSCGYPIIFTPVLYEGHLYSDGGDSLSFPISYFSNLDETIGITFVRHNENTDGSLKSHVEIQNMTDYIIALGSTLTRATYICQLEEKYIKRTIFVKINEPISSMQFNITNEQKNAIYESGRTSILKQLPNILKN